MPLIINYETYIEKKTLTFTGKTAESKALTTIKKLAEKQKVLSQGWNDHYGKYSKWKNPFFLKVNIQNIKE